jgi:hypothetical protein
LGSGKNEQFDLALFRFPLHVLHHWQTTMGTCAHNKATAFPRYVLLDGKGSVRELIAEFLGRLLVALTNLPAIDNDVVLIDDVINLEGTKAKVTKLHRNLLP